MKKIMCDFCGTTEEETIEVEVKEHFHKYKRDICEECMIKLFGEEARKRTFLSLKLPMPKVKAPRIGRSK